MDHNRIEGTAHQVKGAAKEALGKVSGDRLTEAEGKAERMAGQAQDAAGRVADAARDALAKAADGVKNAVKR